MSRTITVEDGKYAVMIDEDQSGTMTIMRKGEPWHVGQQMFGQAGFVLALVQRIEELQTELSAVRSQMLTGD